ncbi:MAG: type II toxin-antitoxin system HicB family antitoxin [Armatimonadetes bacterium]|nr:type II toxin-antitoxin system HicB family antitoxin [Armatimonadota bacterium]
MDEVDKYVKPVEWSDQDGCFIGSCPELFYGGCHGSDPRVVFDELCQIVEETVGLYLEDGKPLPRPMTGRQFVNAMQCVT